MRKTESRGLSFTQAVPRLKLTDTAIQFCRAYMVLASSNRRIIVHFLLQNAMLPDGTIAYRGPGQKLNEIQRHACYTWLRYISQKVADAWLSWANEISHAGSSQRACREMIFGMLRKLVSDESIEEQRFLSPRSVIQISTPEQS